jgi:hypothetical protein
MWLFRDLLILVVYTPEGNLLDCSVTSPSGHIVSDERRPLVACNTHAEDEIKFAHQRWQSTKSKVSNDEQEDE